jgi:membrane-associated phospholipid phosphatase
MTRTGAKRARVCCLLMTLATVCINGYAKPQTQQGSAAATTPSAKGAEKDSGIDALPKQTDIGNEQAIDNPNSIGVSFLKNLVSDQKSIWTSPRHLRWADGAWLFPLAAATAGFLATDRAVPPALSNDPAKLNRYTGYSNYGLYSMIGAGGGLYVWSKIISHDDHERETGILAGEAAINSFAVDTAFKYAFGRERPYQDQGLGNFFQGGDSFPSDHSAVAWSIASVVAHEYPGPLTQIAVYGLATAVSATRVMGQQHFPSDVVVGAAMGWLIGREVYRTHHDPELGGGGWDPLSGIDGGEENRDRKHMGSPSVPLDSWVYSAFERLAALRVINTQLMGVKPWTRIECARLAEEAGETLQEGRTLNDEEAARIQTQLAQEFGYEIALLSGGHNLTANLESVYGRAVSISGPALTDSYYFGQTVSYDFGRPFERGTNGQAGGSFSAAAGPLTLYVRAEYQHAPAAPALSSPAINAIFTADSGPGMTDRVPESEVPAGPFAPTNRLKLLDAYVGVNLGNFQITLGKQSLSWTPAPDGSMIWSDNIDPMNMVRLVNPEPVYFPTIFRILGPVRIDQFFGRLEGHPYVPRPFIYGQKLSIKPVSFLELGFARTCEIGGQGSGNPLTSYLAFQQFFGLTNKQLDSVPGKTSTEMDWTLYVPWVGNYIVLYGDAYAADDVLPIKNPPKNPWRPGIYITRFPGLPKLDLHVDSVSTEQPGLSFDNGYVPGTPANNGYFNYWNQNYQDGYTNGGNLIGNTVGRDGRAFQGWLTYWLSPRNSLQLFYKKSSVAGDFMPGGGAWQDYSVRNEMHLRSGFYMKTELQYEHISRYPILFNGPQRNFTAIVEVGFSPRETGTHKR